MGGLCSSQKHQTKDELVAVGDYNFSVNVSLHLKDAMKPKLKNKCHTKNRNHEEECVHKPCNCPLVVPFDSSRALKLELCMTLLMDVEGVENESFTQQLKLQMGAPYDLMEVPLVPELDHHNEGSFILPSVDIMQLCSPDGSLYYPILTIWVLHLLRLSTELKNSSVYGFIDPATIYEGSLDPSASLPYLTNKLLENKYCYLAPYLLCKQKHWQLFIIEPGKLNVVVLCSLGREPHEKFVKIVERAMDKYHEHKGWPKQKLTWSNPICQRQRSNYESGYYVMNNMLKIVSDTIVDWEKITGNSKSLHEDELNDLRESCAKLILEYLK